MALRRDCTRNAYDWTARLPAIAAAAGRIKAKSFTIDGEAVVVGPDGLSRFDDLRRREAARTAILYAFDLIEHDGEETRRRVCVYGFACNTMRQNKVASRGPDFGRCIHRRYKRRGH